MSKLPVMTADEAASLIKHGETVGFSGFTPAGSPKVIPQSLGALACKEHDEGREFKIGVVTGASTGPSLDGTLARAEAVEWRTPYQSDSDLRKSINAGKTRFFDMHLSMLPQNLRYGFLGPVHCAVIEACDVTDDGEIVLTSAVGAAPTICAKAEKILIERNAYHPSTLRGLHDIYEPASPPNRREIPIYKPSDRIGCPVIKVDPKKIVGVVETNAPDEVKAFDDSTEVTNKIGENVADFLAAEIRRGIIPAEFLPIQSGVGNVANAVLGAMGHHPDIPPFEMFTEVIQNSVIDLMREGHIKFVSGCSLTITPEVLKAIYDELDSFFRERIVLRPQEISNSPELVRRMGLVSINTAIEVDIFGNVNSTHVLGSKMMNGIGGSGDFTRNAFLSIFTAPSTAKDGKISTIVPAVSHTDHSEHSVQIIITDQGVADLRGLAPKERACAIVDNCAHPEFRPILHRYFDEVGKSHTPSTLRSAYAMHEAFLEGGDMRAVDFSRHDL